MILPWQVIILISCAYNCGAKLQPLNQPKFKLSLCMCGLAVSKKYSTTKETITVALPTTDYLSNVSSVITSNQILLSLLSNQTKWSLLTENMAKYTQPPDHYYLEKISRSYIICIRSYGEIVGNIKKLKALNSWNPHSNFVVISATIFDNPLEIANEVLQALWDEQLLDVAVLLANPKRKHVIDVYISQPYGEGNCGQSIGKVQVIDSCIMGAYLKNKRLFNNKIPRRLNNCTLKVGFAEAPPFVMNTRNRYTGTKEYYNTDHGIEINLLNMIANFLGLKLQYYESDSGEIYLNGTATGNLLLLKKDLLDMCIGSYVKTLARSYYFDSSITYMQDRLMWCVPHIPILINSPSFLKILDLPTWLLLILLYILTTVLFWFVSTENGKELRPYHDYKNVAQYVFSTFLGIPVRLQPITFQVRVMFIFIVLFSFCLDSAFQTYLTSVLTGSKYGEKYSSVNDIYQSNLKTYFMPNSNRYFEDKKHKEILDRMIQCYNFQSCMDFVAFDRDSAFCVPKMYVDYIYDSYVTKNNDPLLHCFGNLVSLSINMLMRKGFPLFFKINNIIGRIASAGFITKWKRDILRTRAGNFVANIELDEKNNEFLRLRNLLPVFTGLIICHCLAFVVFIVELRWRKKIKNQ